MRLNTRILIMAALLLLPLGAGAQVSAGSPDTLGTRVYFRQAIYKLDPEFRGNGERLHRFALGVDALLANPEVQVHAVVVETGASPEGGVVYNDGLADNRAKSIRRWLLDNTNLSPYQIQAHGVGADWEGLWHMVRACDDPAFIWKDRVLEVIADSEVRLDPSTANKQRCMDRMKALDGGRAWRWMLENLYPDLRQGAGTLRVIASRPAGNGLRDTVVIIHEYMGPDADWLLGEAVDRATEAATRNVLAALAAQQQPKGYKRDSLYRVPILAFRSNLLVPAMNVGVEVPLGNRWSVGADWYYPWAWRPWVNRVQPAQSVCFQMLGGSVEGRYWLGRAHRPDDAYRKYRLLGHSLGLLVEAGYYDFQPAWKGRQGEYFGVGIDYMYAVPLGKGNVHLEFDIAVGYANTGWRGYEVHETGGKLIGNWEDSSWQGLVPMRAGINLVIPIFEKHRVTTEYHGTQPSEIRAKRKSLKEKED